MSTEPSNSDDLIDSRDVIETIKALEELREEYGDDEIDVDYLEALKALQAEAEPYAADWQFGETLIRDSYFKTYAQELAEDIGAIGRDLQWPLYHIDWEAAAETLQMDYTSVSFDGVDYWIR